MSLITVHDKSGEEVLVNAKTVHGISKLGDGSTLITTNAKNPGSELQAMIEGGGGNQHFTFRVSDTAHDVISRVSEALGYEPFYYEPTVSEDDDPSTKAYQCWNYLDTQIMVIWNEDDGNVGYMDVNRSGDRIAGHNMKSLAEHFRVYSAQKHSPNIL